jgi:aspartate/methionine/tyrosine aminotransferase
VHIKDFALERYFDTYEFTVRYMLGSSDVEGMRLDEVLPLADDETRRLWDGLTLGYTESPGHPLLRAAIAEMYDGLVPDDILVFSGAEEAVFLSMHALIDAGDHVVVVTPAYQSLHEVARSIGADITAIPLDPSDWSLDIDALERALRPNTKVIVANYPHNPTGAHLSRADFDRLTALADSRGIRLFFDEVYRFLERDPADRLPPAATVSARAISLGVMSKSFALAGLRIGWVATRDRTLRARLEALKDYTTICNSAPSEILALIALRAREHVLARTHAIVGANLPVLDSFFARCAEQVSWVRPVAGSISFPSLRRGTADALAERLVRDEGVLIIPGSIFGGPPSHFRLGFGRRDMPEALARLERVLLSS